MPRASCRAARSSCWAATSRAAGGASTLREVDLAGDTLRETNIDAVNAELAALGQHSITDFNHDAQRLPNGDTAVLATTPRTINVNGTPTTYTGDMVLVLDQNFQVAWAWDPFNWLDTNRLPTLGEGPSDWTARQLHRLVARGREPDRLPALPGLGDQDRLRQRDGRRPRRLAAGARAAISRINSTDPSPWFSHQHDVRYINDTTLVLFDNGNTRRATNPRANSRGQELVLDETDDAGDAGGQCRPGQLLRRPGERADAPQREPRLHVRVRRTGSSGQSIEVLPDGTKTYVQQMPGLEYRSYFMSTLYGSPANLYDPGFEDPLQGTGTSAYQYRPTGSAWTFSGTAGVAGNGSGFTAGNPDAPQGSQVAFLQKTGSISQVVDFTRRPAPT